MEARFTPIAWMRETYRASRLALFLPLAGGLAAAQLFAALLVLRSYHTPLWTLCLVSAVYATWRGFAFLYWLYAEDKAGVTPLFDTNALYRTFVPLLISSALYMFAAPTTRLWIFFVAMSLPYVLFLSYLAYTSARVAISIHLPSLPALPPLPAIRALKFRVTLPVYERRVPEGGA
ncbi:hypothetical protein EXS62_00190 [Candidatus Kaiserbacteria bacterium]|nr:hypothetical protein [Candidatus Kaiserbacteria bacterium]